MQLLSTLSTIAAIPLGKVARIATPPAFAPLLAALGVSESGVDGETRQVAAVPGKRLPVDPAGVTPEMLGFVPAPIPLAAPPPVVSGSVAPTMGDAPRSAFTDVRAAPAPSTGPSAPVGGEASLRTTPTGERAALATPEPGRSGKPDDRPAPDLPDPLPIGANTGPRLSNVEARPENIVERATDIGAPPGKRAAVVAGDPPASAVATASATLVSTISHAPSASLQGASLVAADRAAPLQQTASTGATSSAQSALATSSTVGMGASDPTMPMPIPGGPTVTPPPSRHREPMPDDALRALIASLPLIDAPRPPVGGMSGAPRSGQTQPIARRGTDLPFEAPVASNAAIQLPIGQAPVATPLATPPAATPATEVSFAASAVAPSPSDPAPRPPMAGETIAPRVVVASSVVASAPPVEPMIVGASVVGTLNAGTSTTDASAAGPTATPTDAGTTAPVPPRPQMTGEAVAPRIAIATAPREAGVAPADRRERERDSAGTIAAPAPIDLAPRPVLATAAAERPALDTRDGAWMQGMIDRIETLRSEGVGGTTRIRLSPDALGAIEVSIQPGDDGMQVRFASDNPDAARLLADAQPKLVELAEARGLKLGAMQVDVGQHSQQQPRREAPAQQNFRSRPAHAATPARPDEPTTDDVRIA